MVLSRLVRESDAVLMDLRGFTRDNAGCVFELKELARMVPLERVVFVIDRRTDETLLMQTLGKCRAGVYRLDAINGRHVRRLMRSLAAAAAPIDTGHVDNHGDRMLTAEHVQAIMPAVPRQKRDALLPYLQAALTEFGIQAPARAAAFLAQLAHESGQFRFMEEIWGPTPAQRRYEPVTTLAANLGNTEPGDGKRFKGRGPIQITGRANYRRFGDLLGTDLVADPARAALPELAFRIAGLFWSKKGLNELADRATHEAFREITRRINGGYNGLEDRQKFYTAACAVLGVSEPRARDADRPFPLPKTSRGSSAASKRFADSRSRTPSREEAACSPQNQSETAQQDHAQKENHTQEEEALTPLAINRTRWPRPLSGTAASAGSAGAPSRPGARAGSPGSLA